MPCTAACCCVRAGSCTGVRIWAATTRWDKAVGCALTEGVPLAECVLFTSGRVPVDMVRKAIRAGVPALVSKSMPTVQSLELAEEYGLKLFIRQKK